MGKEEITTIPYTRKVFYATYANLPTAGLKVGDLGYATDRLVFYRWSGAAWQAVTIHSSSGTAANIPAAADLPEGSLYYTTDTKLLRQVQAGAWVTIMIPPALLTDFLLYPALTEEAPKTEGYIATTKRYAHGILSHCACVITKIGVLIGAKAGNGSNIIIEIWDDSGGDANAVIANGSVTIEAASIAANVVNWFTFPTPPSLAAATLYHVVLRSSDTGGINYWSMALYDGVPLLGKGFWGTGTRGRHYTGAAWEDKDPFIDIIYGRKA